MKFLLANNSTRPSQETYRLWSLADRSSRKDDELKLCELVILSIALDEVSAHKADTRPTANTESANAVVKLIRPQAPVSIFVRAQLV
jgi:hypothetical protein